MFRHGCTAINFKWFLIRLRWFSSLLNTTRRACLSLSLSIWIEPWFIFLQLSTTWAAPSTRISLFSSMSPAPVKSASLNCIGSILSIATCHKMLSRHFCLSRIDDYCSSVLTGCPKLLTYKFQKVQNDTARLICQTLKSDHISPILHPLQWLSVEWRIEYNTLLLAFRSVKNKSLSYLSDILKFYILSW